MLWKNLFHPATISGNKLPLLTQWWDANPNEHSGKFDVVGCCWKMHAKSLQDLPHTLDRSLGAFADSINEALLTSATQVPCFSAHAGSQVIVDSTELSQLIEPGPAQPIVLCLIWRRVGFAYSASNIDGCPGWIWVTSWIGFLLVSETTDGPWKQLFTTFMTIGGRVLVAGAKNKALVAQVFDFVGPGQKGSGPSCGLLVGPPCFFIMAVFPTWGVSFAAICCMFPRFQKSCLSLRKKGEKPSHIR